MTTESMQISKEESGTIISPTKNITLRISRSNPKISSEQKFDEFTVPYQKWTTVLDAILEVKKYLDLLQLPFLLPLLHLETLLQM